MRTKRPPSQAIEGSVRTLLKENSTLTPGQIARRLRIGEATAKRHKERILSEQQGGIVPQASQVG